MQNDWVTCPMVEVCSPAVSEDRGHTSKVDGPESLAISICDVSYKLMNLKIILISHCPCDGVRRQMSYSKSRCRHFHFGKLYVRIV